MAVWLSISRVCKLHLFNSLTPFRTQGMLWSKQANLLPSWDMLPEWGVRSYGNHSGRGRGIHRCTWEKTQRDFLEGVLSELFLFL